MTQAATLECNTSENHFDLLLDKLKSELGDAAFKSWFLQLHYIRHTNTELVVAVPTRFKREWILSNYSDKIIKYWKAFYPNSLTLEIEVNQALGDKIPKEALSESLNQSSSLVLPFTAKDDDALSAVLDPRYTFEHFVIGKPNELAHAAARAVAESPNVLPGSNPLFLYGGVGLGKTHLMHAIAWHIRNTHPHRKVVYLSAEKFMYLFIRALRDKNIMSFKEQFRSVDVLMIDDVQFICGKDSTQEEFFHTFNALIDQNRQLVISCDRSPSDLDGMEERVRSRLGWGLVADIHSTNYELRLGILLAKVEQMNQSVPREVIEFLASKIQSNVRELEGALNKVVAHAMLVGGEITLERTHDILRDLLRSYDKAISLSDIQKAVAEYYNVKLSDLSSTRRQRSIARPRQMAMYLCKVLTTKSLIEIGRQFGGKDHTTVIHAVKRVEALLDEEAELVQDIRLLKRILDA